MDEKTLGKDGLKNETKKASVDVATLDLSVRDLSVELSEKEKLAIEAQAHEEVLKELHASKVKEFKENAKRRLRQKAMFSEGKNEDGDDVETVTLNLAPVQPCITLDGRRYHHGHTYKLSKAVVAVIKDQQFRGWKEESARLGENMNAFYGRQKMNAAIGPNGLNRLQ